MLLEMRSGSYYPGQPQPQRAREGAEQLSHSHSTPLAVESACLCPRLSGLRRAREEDERLPHLPGTDWTTHATESSCFRPGLSHLLRAPEGVEQFSHIHVLGETPIASAKESSCARPWP